MKIITLTEKQAKFTFYAIRERLAFQELAKHKGYMTHMLSDESGYDKWDVIYSDANTRNIAELKVRKHSSTDFNGKWILERSKYEALTTSIEGRIVEFIRLKPTFIIFFYDCIAIFDMSKIDPTSFKTERLRASSVSGEEEAVDKEVTYMDIKTAEVIPYSLDFDKLSYNAKIVMKYKYPNNSKHVINI